MTVHLEKYQGDGIIISLLLTKACTFSCGHCMYNCSPKVKSTYMDESVLCKVKRQIDLLNDLDIRVTINLIGGEPTFNMDEFERVLNVVGRWAVDIEMTTNGWWLKNEEDTKRFMEIVQPYISMQGTAESWETGERFCVRISNDPYHNEFRPNNLQGAEVPYYSKGDDKLTRALANLWEDGTFFPEEQQVCPSCWKVVNDDYCPDCEIPTEYEALEDGRVYAPPPDSNDPWIYVERFMKNSMGIAPNGRGVNVSVMGDNTGRGGGVTFLSYLPDGKLMDVCGKGSWCQFGTVDDSPIYLAEVTKEFFRQREKGDGCWTCRQEAKEWKNKHLARTRRQKAHLNTFDANELLEQPDVLESEMDYEEEESEEVYA